MQSPLDFRADAGEIFAAMYRCTDGGPRPFNQPRQLRDGELALEQHDTERDAVLGLGLIWHENCGLQS
jgi:hypothetical protein